MLEVEAGDLLLEVGLTFLEVCCQNDGLSKEAFICGDSQYDCVEAGFP